MTLQPAHQAYLDEYLATLATDAPQRGATVEASPFGDSPRLADELGQLIVSGVKTATCSTVAGYEVEGAPIPPVGLLTIVLDGRGEPLCIIETTAVEIRPFNQVDAQFAYEEGEDDRTLASWRSAHWRYFSRTLPKEYGLEPTQAMPLVCERFQRVYPA